MHTTISSQQLGHKTKLVWMCPSVPHLGYATDCDYHPKLLHMVGWAHSESIGHLSCTNHYR